MKKLLLFFAGLILAHTSVFAQQTFSWSQIADYPYKAWGMNSCGYDGYLYTFSNCGGANNNLYRYDAGADKWDTLANLSGSGICNTSIAGANGKLYIAGSGVINVFDISTGQFETNTISTPSQFNQNGVAAVVDGNTIYYIGGGSTKNTYKLDVTTQTFTKLTDMNEGRENAQATYMAGKLYVIAGRKNGGALSSGEVYDIANDSWTNLTTTFEKRYFGFAFADSNYIYLMGGETGTNSFKYKTIELFDPANNTITIMDTTVNNMNREHTAHGMGVSGNKLVAAGGYTNTPNNSTTEYCEAANFKEVTNILKQHKAAIDFKLYPNPANDAINIQIANPAKITALELYNTNGQVVAKDQLSNTKELTLNTANIPSGIYIIKVRSSNGASQAQPVEIRH